MKLCGAVVPVSNCRKARASGVPQGGRASGSQAPSFAVACTTPDPIARNNAKVQSNNKPPAVFEQALHSERKSHGHFAAHLPTQRCIGYGGGAMPMRPNNSSMLLPELRLRGARSWAVGGHVDTMANFATAWAKVTISSTLSGLRVLGK